MRREQVSPVGIWSAPDETRASEIERTLETLDFDVSPLELSSPPPALALLLPGTGQGPALATVCARLAEAMPQVPTVLLHSIQTERSLDSEFESVFVALPACVDSHGLAARLPRIVARWEEVQRLTSRDRTLERLETTTGLIYFDFRSDDGTFSTSVQLQHMIGHAPENARMSPSPLLERIHTDDRALFAGTLFEAARSGAPFGMRVRLNDVTGRLCHLHVRGRSFDAEVRGEMPLVFAACEDITEHMQRLAEAEARSLVDELTGLGNRRHFDDGLATVLARAKRKREQMALLYVDLDRFKHINDTLGHDAGDQLLRIISARLSEVVRAQDLVCGAPDAAGTPEARLSRLGGDEFTILLSGIHGPPDAEQVAKRLLASLKRPVVLAAQMLTPSASIGIAMYPADGERNGDLRRRADAALYAAKGAGGGFRLFTKSMEDGALRRLALEHELRGALERNELEIHYQPRVDYRTLHTTGAEALLRWTSPTLGRVSPTEIFRIAEDIGVIASLGRWVLNQACLDASDWPSSRDEPVRLSVNVSALQFDHDDVFSTVVDALKNSGVSPDLLDLEITEDLLLREDATIARSLEELRRMGVRVVLDDFGKGYSALAVLMDQPIDVLKLDRRLIETVAPDGSGSHLLANVIRMAQDLHLHPIAEGVSHGDQAEFLSAKGCHEMQGFYFSAAIPADRFREKLEIE